MSATHGTDPMQELRGIIRSLLAEAPLPDPPVTFTRKRDNTVFTQKSAPTNASPSAPYVYTGTPTGGKLVTLSYADKAAANAAIARLTGVKPPAAATKPGAAKKQKLDLKLDTDKSFEKLNQTLIAYHKANSLTFQPTVVYGGVSVAAADIPKTMTENIKTANPGTVAYMIGVCEDLKTKIDAAKSDTSAGGGLKGLFDRWQGRKAKKEQITSIDALYKEDTWSKLIADLKNSGARPNGINPLILAYLNSVQDDVSRDPDGFARYISDLAGALRAPGAAQVAVESGSAPPTQPGTPGEMGDLAALKTFLAGKETITSVKAPIDDKTVYTALAAFVKAVRESNANDRSFTSDSAPANETIISTLAPLGAANTKELIANWKGAKYMSQDFPGTSEGLVQFLKFSYIMRAEADAKAAAKTMGYEAAVSNLVNFEGAEPALIAARTVGALSPTAYIVIKGPSVKIPKGARLAITENTDLGTTTAQLEKGTSENNIFVTEFISDYPNGLRLVLGKQKGAQDGGMTVDHGGRDAEAIVAAGLKGGVTLTLKIGEDVYTLPNQSYKLGSEIKFEQATTAGPGAVGGPDFGDLAGIPASGADVPGMSQEGPLQFSMRSIYPDATGKLETADLNATINKDVKRERDRFTIQVSPLNTKPTSFILIPVPLRRPLQEGAHWSLKMLDTGEKRPSVVLMPITSVEYNFKGNKINYGTTFENLTTVSYTPYNDQLEAMPNLNVMTANQLIGDPKLGLTQADLDKAVKAYLGDEQNPIGGAMLRTASVHNAMNSYRRAAPITF